ncbi:MAG: ChrR family anti-sigma-E factor [Motiliproteus sp.]|nr:ChrR family anti-sigma-E factor [Motiliproteus sp.]MCW9053782.1 ChrR family anti-sigma-E factor [Motiliproteus sp.]
MKINHHLDDATLVSYSAGALSQGMALVVASHLAICPECQRRNEQTDAIGGALLDDLVDDSAVDDKIDDGMLNDLLAKLDEEPEVTTAAPWPKTDIPRPLAEYVGANLERVEWKRIVPGVYFHELPFGNGGVSRLLRIAPGKTILPHSHEGNELTLILRGSFSDELGRFAAGDVADLDDQVEHQPLVDSSEDCICLVATDAPLRFTTWFGRLVQPITGF